MLQSLSFREAVVTWPHSAYGGKWLGWLFIRFRCILRRAGGNNAQATVRFGIRVIGMRTRDQRLIYNRGSRMTLGREGNRDFQNFPRFGRGFDSHRPLQILKELHSFHIF